MFGFRSRKSARTPARKPVARLGIEALEDRSLPVADLTVSSVVAPLVVAPGESLAARFVVGNVGDTAAAGSWLDAVLLSEDGAPNLGDPKLAERTRTGGLAAGASYTVNVSGTVPDGLGLRHVLAQTDRADAVPEPDNGSANSLAAPVAVVPAFAVGFVRGLVDPLQTALGAANEGLPLRVGGMTVGTDKVTVTLTRNPAFNPTLAGFKVSDVTVTVTATTSSASATGTVKLVAPAEAGSTEIVATLTIGADGVFKVAGTATAPELRVGTDTGLWAKSPKLTADVTVALAALKVTGGVTVTADRAVVFTNAPATGDPTGPVTVTTVSATLAHTGKLTGSAKNLTAAAGELVTASATGVAVNYDPADANGLLLSVGKAAAKVVVLGKDVHFAGTDLKVFKSGKVSFGSLATDAAKALPKVRFAEVLPFTVESVTVAGVGGGAARLDRFDLTVKGKFDFGVFDGLPAKPVVRVGARNVASGADAFAFTVRNDGGAVKVQETGQIQLGFADLKFPPLTVGATVTLGGFADGAFKADPFGATFDLKADTKAVDLSAGVKVEGGITTAKNGNTTVALTGTLTADFKLSNDAVVVDDAGLKFRLGWTVKPDGSRVGSPTLALDGLTVKALSVKVSDLLTVETKKVAFDFKAGADKPFVTFGEAGLVFGGAAGVLTGWGGTASNFGLGADGKLYLLDGAKVALTVPKDFKFGLPDWLPVSFTKFGIAFPGADKVGGSGLSLPAPKKLANVADWGFVVSGGLTANATFPITAQLNDLEVHPGDLVRALKGENVPFPIKNLSGVDVGISEFELGKGFKVGGRLSFGSVTVDEKPVLYGRVKGGFTLNDVGAEVDLILSSVGPVLATVSAPLAVPLGPSGLVLSGVSGGLLFGSSVPSVNNPMDLVGSKSDPRWGNPLDQASKHPKGIDGFIADSVSAAVRSGTSTVNSGFTVVLAGTVTHVAAAGMVTARATLGANVAPKTAAAAGGLKLLGFGDVYAQGMPLGDAKVILDFADPIAPKLAVAFQTPTPGSPLGFLLPASGTLVAGLDTKGLALGTAIGVRTFVQKVGAGTAGAANAFFRDALDRVADRLAADTTRPLAKFVLDVNGNNVLSAAEKAVTNDLAAFRTVVRDRLLALLPADFAAVTAAAGATLNAKLAKFAKVAQAATAELFDALAAAQKAAATAPNFDQYLAGFAAGVKDLVGGGGKAVLAFADVLKDAVASAARAAAAQFDPVLVISGKLQPTLLGVPFGPAKQNVDLRLSKTGLFFGGEFSLGREFTAAVTGGLTSALNVPLPVTDAMRVDVQLPFVDAFADLARGKLPALDPVGGGWLIGLAGAVDVLGYRVGPASALLFPKNNPGLLKQRVQVVGDGERDNAKIQVADAATFDKLARNGGLLLDGTLTVPKLLADPAALAKLVGSTLPDPQADPAGFLSKLMALPQALGQLDTLAQVQTFLPLGGGRAADAYLTGKLTGKVLSVSLADGTLDATKDTLTITGKYLGATAKLTVDRSASGFPRAIAEATVGTTALAAMFDALGLPAGFLKSPTTGANAKLRLVSPGFDATSKDPLLKSGGVELTASLDIPNVVEDTDFLVRLTPPTAGGLPDFKARATADRLAIPGLSQAGLLTLKDFTVDLTKTGTTTKLRLNGKAELFGTALKADGTFTLSSAGLFGAFELKSLAGGAVPALAGTGFNVSGKVFVLVNTTSTSRTVAVNGRNVSIPARSGKLHADGSVAAGGFKLAGRFDLAAGAGGLAVMADAALDLGRFGDYTVDGTFTAKTSGLVADLRIDADGGQGSGFSLDGTFRLKLNTTGTTVNGVAPGLAVSVTDGELRLNGLGSTFKLTGSMTVGFKDNAGTANDFFFLSVPRSAPLTASLWGGAVRVNFFGEVRSTGFVDLTATGKLRTEFAGWEFDADLTVRVTGTAAAGLTFSGRASGDVTYLGFDLFDVDIKVSAAGRVTASAKYHADVPLVGRQTLAVSVSFDL